MNEQLTLTCEFDIVEDQTKRNARKVLENYRRLERIAGKSVVDLKSPMLSDMPKSPSNGNHSTDALDKKIQAELERDQIIYALSRLPIRHRLILFYTYCSVERYSINDIALKLADDKTEVTISRDKADALLEFAEAYKGGSLLVFK